MFWPIGHLEQTGVMKGTLSTWSGGLADVGFASSAEAGLGGEAKCLPGQAVTA